MRLVAYNIGQGGSRDASRWQRAFQALAPDLFFVQESRNPADGWLPALTEAAGKQGALHWSVVPNGRWGSGIWLRSGTLTPLPVPADFEGRVATGLVEGLAWPGAGASPVVVLSVHAPTRKGSSYIKEVGRILDFAQELAEDRPLILAGDFNVVVGMREPGQPIGVTPGERALLTRIEDELGLVPCWQTTHPGEPLARTLRWMRRLDSLPYHCDGIFMPAAWAPSLKACEVLESDEWHSMSDHNPVVAVLNV